MDSSLLNFNVHYMYGLYIYPENLNFEYAENYSLNRNVSHIWQLKITILFRLLSPYGELMMMNGNIYVCVLPHFQLHLIRILGGAWT